ncbi:peptidoglycan-binding protein [Pseudoxanthomonas winnipegensis]|uniref:Lytic transglycosylase n=1 Tax=Pseudoxanthomonas winnipegensis TaxID=2480810 RepID=A0A4Q8LX91_9GAMM|nr:peptidoglycan-binding protein [Pseudoxanthomonas winnipegensis]TAA36770.1 lytic transglycosylase [Pseudoxanthomonas winnipegensis]
MTDDTIYTEMVQPRGAAYRSDRIKPWSHYREPIDAGDGRLHGESRRWGDATPQTQSRVIDNLIDASREAGLSSRETAYVLAIARVESGFNPDAAAGTTSASGLGQFIDRTGGQYGLNNANRFDVRTQSQALVQHFIDNRDLARSRGHGEDYIYKYHHDGPSKDYGGLGLSQREVAPYLDRYERFVEQRLSQTQTQGHAPTHAAPSPASHAQGHGGFQQTTERMLPGQGGQDPHITGNFGEHRGKGPHGGTDFNYEGGQAGRNLRHPTVHAPIDGTVTFSGGQYGTVKIRDAQGNSHEILHLDSRSVKEGQVVRAGDPIGTMGGRGPEGAGQYAQHVHYQLRDPQGHLISPQTFWDRHAPAQTTSAPTSTAAPHRGAGAEVLQHGDHGPNVRALQQQLNTLGVRDEHGRRLAEDGKFGTHTQAAVERLQRTHGIAVDGEVGPDTRRALAARPAIATPGLDQASHPDHRLYTAIRAQVPAPYSNELAAHITVQAKQHGIDTPEKVGGVAVQDGKAYVVGTTPGFRATVDLAQPPSFEHSSQQLLAQQRAAPVVEPMPVVAMQR